MEIPLAAYPAPEILVAEIAIDQFPVLAIVTPRTLLPPRLTFPKSRLVALAANDPDSEEVAPEFEFAACVPTPVTPPQAERNNAARKVRKMADDVSGMR